MTDPHLLSVRRAGPRRRRQGGPGSGLDTPLDYRRGLMLTTGVDQETFGRWSERFARFMGTAWFIVAMTVFVIVWLTWNTFGPAQWQFDPRRLNYTMLTLILSLQASYAAPLILLAQNRQADRDRVAFEQDRQRSERALADTEYLAREVVALRIALREIASRDLVRDELRTLREEIRELSDAVERTRPDATGTGDAADTEDAADTASPPLPADPGDGDPRASTGEHRMPRRRG